MGQGAQARNDLAARILAEEAGGHPSGIALGEAAERAYEKLSKYLARLIGSHAAQLVIRRALQKTVDEFPFLKGVDVALDGRLGGLRENIAERSPAEVGDGLATMLANLVGLLYDLIGEDVTLSHLRNVWPSIIRQCHIAQIHGKCRAQPPRDKSQG